MRPREQPDGGLFPWARLRSYRSFELIEHLRRNGAPFPPRTVFEPPLELERQAYGDRGVLCHVCILHQIAHDSKSRVRSSGWAAERRVAPGILTARADRRTCSCAHLDSKARV